MDRRNIFINKNILFKNSGNRLLNNFKMGYYMSNIFEDNGLVLYWDDFINTFDILKQLYDEHGKLYIVVDLGAGDDKDVLIELGEETYFFMTEVLHEASMKYSPKEAKFDILEIYNYKNNSNFAFLENVNEIFYRDSSNFALLGNVNENMLLIVAYLISCLSEELVLIFSNEPNREWLHDYLKTICDYENPSPYYADILYHWHTIIHQFHFCLFNQLPDWDSSSNLLIVSKDQQLFHKFMFDKKHKFYWKKLKMSMFPMND